MTVGKEIGERIKGIAGKKDLKQLDLARQIDVDYRSFNKRINGNAEFKVDEILKIANILEVSTDYLISGHDRGDSETSKNTKLSGDALHYLNEKALDGSLLPGLLSYCLEDCLNDRSSIKRAVKFELYIKAAIDEHKNKDNDMAGYYEYRAIQILNDVIHRYCWGKANNTNI